MTVVKRAPFEIENREGDPLRGDVRTPAESKSGAAIVLCHGFKGFKDWGFFPYLAEQLAARTHWPVVSFNFSGSGIGPDLESFTDLERFAKNTFTRELEDLGGILDAAGAGDLPSLGPTERFGLFGHSRGGGVAIIRAAEDERVRCLVTWAAIATVRRWSEDEIKEWRRRGRHWVLNTRTGQRLPLGIDLLEDIEENADRLDILAAASRLRIPYLIVHGTEDETVAASEGDLIAEAAPSEYARLERIEGAGHTFGAVHPFRGPSDNLSRAVDLTVEALARGLED